MSDNPSFVLSHIIEAVEKQFDVEKDECSKELLELLGLKNDGDEADG